MDYETFRALWLDALRESGLPVIGDQGTETLDTRHLDRVYTGYVEPLGGQDAAPFHVTAQLSWRWDALTNLRGTARDEDVLSEMLGRDQAEDLLAEKACVHVDIKLRATSPDDKPFPMPSRVAWSKWVEETVDRLDRIEPLLPDEILRVNRTGKTEVLAWQDAPKLTAVCDASGALLLEGVELSAGQLVEIPRLLDSANRPDEGPEAELAELLGRVRASLTAWMQALDHLRPR
ncbi:MAG: hypothetical protein K0R38_2633 [Polyangiaceae bacterium]|nr:hypothetical protein [Polyangiaceae bacterium]